MWRPALAVLLGCQVGLMASASPYRVGRAEDRMVGDDEHGHFPARPGASFPAWPSSDSHWADVPSHMGASDHWGQWGAAAPLVQVAARDASGLPQQQQPQQQPQAYGQDFSFGGNEDPDNDDFSEHAKRHVDNKKFPGGNDFKSAAQAFSRPTAFEQEPATYEQPEQPKPSFGNGYSGANEQFPSEQEEGQQQQFGGPSFDFGQYQPDQDYDQQPATYALPPKNQGGQQQQREPQEYYSGPQSQQESRPPQEEQYGQYDIPEPDFKVGDPEDGEGADEAGASAFDPGFGQGFPVNVQFDSNSPGHNAGNEYATATPEPVRARPTGYRPQAPTPAPSQYDPAKRPERETVSYNTAVTHGPTGSSQSYANFGFRGEANPGFGGASAASPSAAQAKSPPPPLYTSTEDDAGFESAQSGFPKPKFADFGTPFPTFDDRQQSDVGQPERPQYSRPDLPSPQSEREPEPKQEKRQGPKVGDYKYSRINYREPIDRLMKKSEGGKAADEESANRDYSSSYGGGASAYSGSADAKREQPKRRYDQVDPRNKKSEITSIQKEDNHDDDSSGYYAPSNKATREEGSDEEVVAESAKTEIRKEATAKTDDKTDDAGKERKMRG